MSHHHSGDPFSDANRLKFCRHVLDLERRLTTMRNVAQPLGDTETLEYVEQASARLEQLTHEWVQARLARLRDEREEAS